MTLLLWSDHQRDHGTARGARADDRLVFSRPVRRSLEVYVAAVVLAALVLPPASLDQDRYLEAFVLVSAVSWAPGVFVAWRAARQAPREDRLVWRLWVAGFAIGCIVTVRLLLSDDAALVAVQGRSVAAAIGGVVLLVAANTLVLRSRGGQRAVLIDLADIVMAVASVVAPLVLVVGEPIAEAEARWFPLAAAIWCVGALYGTGVAVVLYLRVRPGERVVASVGVVFGIIAVTASAAQVVMGTSNFTLRPGPFLAAHALCAGFTVLFLAHSTRRASAGLERLPARAQVRRRPAVTLLVLVSIPVTGALVAARHEDEWAFVLALGTAAVLVSLFCVRSLLAAHETRQLYREVERSADERAELLTDVLAHADADRHRMATHLHRQSVQLYTALSTVVEPIGSEDGRATAAARVAEHLRDDLGRQSEDLRRLALAVRPPCDDAGRAPAAGSSFTTLLRAHLDRRYPEGRRPRFEAQVDPDLVLDWTDEAVLVRVAEEAFAVLSRRAPAATWARVHLGVDGRDLLLDLELDATSPAHDPDESDLRGAGAAVAPEEPDRSGVDLMRRAPLEQELAPARAGAELIGGVLSTSRSRDSIGVQVRVPFAHPGSARPGDPARRDASAVRPALRLVDRG